jgi:hypothetical protein
MSGPRILVWDIETSPHKAWSFGTRNVNIFPDQIIEPTRMICWAAKWLGEKRIMFRSEYHDSTEIMRQELRDLLDEADVTVTYNGDHFDHKHAKREFHLGGIAYPSDSISVDMYKVIKKAEVWHSHKMDVITKQLGLSEKLAHHGFMLWREAMGDFGPERQEKAWRIMRRYNKRDIPSTEDLFVEYEPVITNIPAVGLWIPESGSAGEIPECPNPLCLPPKAAGVTRQGWKRTKTRRYRQYQCQACGKWFSETRSEMGVSVT